MLYLYNIKQQLKTNIMKTEILNNTAVKYTISVIRVMWDVRNEKSTHEKQSWLNGMCKDAENTLSMLFSSFAKGNENTKQFAKRLAQIK